MNCSPFDLKDYFFGALGPAERAAAESHLDGCQDCREELSKLADVHTMLLSVPDEEPQRRIAFVSDKVFQPRWWQRIWSSGPQLGFASAALLAVAILIHAFAAPKPMAMVPPSQSSQAVEQQVKMEVARVLADRDAQLMGAVLQIVNASEPEQRRQALLIGEYLENQSKRSRYTLRNTLYE